MIIYVNHFHDHLRFLLESRLQPPPGVVHGCPWSTMMLYHENDLVMVHGVSWDTMKVFSWSPISTMWISMNSLPSWPWGFMRHDGKCYFQHNVIRKTFHVKFATQCQTWLHGTDGRTWGTMDAGDHKGQQVQRSCSPWCTMRSLKNKTKNTLRTSVHIEQTMMHHESSFTFYFFIETNNRQRIQEIKIRSMTIRKLRKKCKLRENHAASCLPCSPKVVLTIILVFETTKRT